MKPRRLVKVLEQLGFVFHRQRGSHAVYRHRDGRMAIIPMHPHDIPPGTLRGLLNDISISVEKLNELL